MLPAFGEKKQYKKYNYFSFTRIKFFREKSSMVKISCNSKDFLLLLARA
jgi:hypothetical protein